MDISPKKQIPLRISDRLYIELERWAEDEFRSVNGQIEYLLTECVKRRCGSKARASVDEQKSDCRDEMT